MLHSFLSSMSGSGGSDASKSYDGEASNYSTLPAAAAANNNHIYLVSTTSGNNQAGFYKSNGSSWVYVGHDHDSLDDIAEGSTNKHFTQTNKTKLDGIEEGAEVNVNADWSSSSGASQILNKPTDITDLSSHTATELSDISSSGSGVIITSAERTKLNNIAENAEVNVQSDFNQSDTNSDDFIKNKPTTNQLIDWTTQNQGSIDVSNLPSISLTTVQTAANESAQLGLTTQEGDVVVRSDQKKTYIRNSGSAGTMADFTLLETPTDAVTSVNGETGAVTVGNVTIQATDPTSSSAFASSKIILNNTNGRLFWLKSDNSRIYYSINDSYIDLSFSIASFSDNISTLTQLIGSGTFKAIGAITFSCAYNNGPPTSAIVKEIQANPDLQVASNTGNSFTNTVAVPYPSSRGGSVRFRLTADGLTRTESTVTFQNNIKHGRTTKASGYNSADIVGLSGTDLSDDHTRSEAITGTTSNTYIIFAHPAAYATLHSSRGFYYNSYLAGFESPTTVSVTNSAGYTEDYKVYRSTIAGMANATLQTSTSALSYKNQIYYGASSATSLADQAAIKGLDSSLINNDHTRTFSYSGVSNEYIYLSVPSRLTDYNASGWKYNGELMSFTKQGGTINVQNPNGYTEAYETYRSDVLVIGNHSLITSTSAHSGALKVYYGKCNKNSSFTEADIEGLDNGVLTSDATQTWDAIQTSATHQYWAIALPTNLTSSGSLSFTDTGTGFAVGMSASSPETVSVTNIYGVTQNYYVYATNQQLGASTTITVRSS